MQMNVQIKMKHWWDTAGNNWDTSNYYTVYTSMDTRAKQEVIDFRFSLMFF